MSYLIISIAKIVSCAFRLYEWLLYSVVFRAAYCL